jgi:hypothetical protein
MSSMKYRVEIQTIPGSDCGLHGSVAAAEKRVARLVAMSRGKLTTSHFKIVPTENGRKK